MTLNTFLIITLKMCCLLSLNFLIFIQKQHQFYTIYSNFTFVHNRECQDYQSNHDNKLSYNPIHDDRAHGQASSQQEIFVCGDIYVCVYISYTHTYVHTHIYMHTHITTEEKDPLGEYIISFGMNKQPSIFTNKKVLMLWCQKSPI